MKIKTTKKCKECGAPFNVFNTLQKYCSRSCYIKGLPERTTGKGNPNYRNGLRLGGKEPRTTSHRKACSKYRKAFIEQHGYLFCEINKEHESYIFSTHHIYFASRYPGHAELHNPLNLLITCVKCHNGFHSNKMQEEFERLEKERGLKKLFEKNI